MRGSVVKHLDAHRLRLAGAAPCIAAWSPQAPGQDDAPALDERGWLTCRALSGMSLAVQSGFLMGLREGWQTSGALEANATIRAAAG